MTLTVVLTGLPKDRFEGCGGLTNIRIAKQTGKHPTDIRKVGAPTHTLTYTVEVRPNKKTGEPDFYGPEVFGTADRRFLYAQWIGDSPQAKDQLFRRLKIDLNGIAQKQAFAGKPLTVEVQGCDKTGTPACATAKMGKWK
jgi:hypothetical protein